MSKICPLADEGNVRRCNDTCGWYDVLNDNCAFVNSFHRIANALEAINETLIENNDEKN